MENFRSNWLIDHQNTKYISVYLRRESTADESYESKHAKEAGIWWKIIV